LDQAHNFCAAIALGRDRRRTMGAESSTCCQARTKEDGLLPATEALEERKLEPRRLHFDRRIASRIGLGLPSSPVLRRASTWPAAAQTPAEIGREQESEGSQEHDAKDAFVAGVKREDSSQSTSASTSVPTPTGALSKKPGVKKRVRFTMPGEADADDGESTRSLSSGSPTSADTN